LGSKTIIHADLEATIIEEVSKVRPPAAARRTAGLVRRGAQ